MKKYFAALGAFALSALPLVAFAQQTKYIDDWLEKGEGWLTKAITIIMVLLTVWFLISVFNFIRADPAKKGEEKKKMLNGLLGLFIAVSVWGIIRIAQRIVGTDASIQVDIVCPPGTRAVDKKCVI